MSTKKLLLFGGLGMLAVALFFAGAAWQARHPSTAVNTSATDARGGAGTVATATVGVSPRTTNRGQEPAEEAKSAPDAGAAAVPGQDGLVIINGRPLSESQIQQLRTTYGSVAPPGRYWYDSRSGMWGLEGHEAAGLVRPGHDFGPLSPQASRGNTGVFINGREINMAEAAFYQRLAGRVYQGRWWLDGQGNVGLEGNPVPLGNIVAAIQQSQKNAQKGGFWNQSVSGMVGESEGNCSIVTTDTGSWETPGCSQ